MNLRPCHAKWVGRCEGWRGRGTAFVRRRRRVRRCRKSSPPRPAPASSPPDRHRRPARQHGECRHDALAASPQFETRSAAAGLVAGSALLRCGRSGHRQSTHPSAIVAGRSPRASAKAARRRLPLHLGRGAIDPVRLRAEASLSSVAPVELATQTQHPRTKSPPRSDTAKTARKSWVIPIRSDPCISYRDPLDILCPAR